MAYEQGLEVDWPHWPGRPSGPARREQLQRRLFGAVASNGRHLLFASGTAGYVLLEREGEPPPVGAQIALGDRVYVVAKVGSSPLPEDARPCAYAERASGP